MSGSPCVRWESAFLSHSGTVRAVNEDSCLNAPDLGVWVVADGMGGHEAGQTASRMIVDALQVLPAVRCGETTLAAVRDRIAAVNAAIIELSRVRYDGRTVGSTVAVLIACNGDVVCLWAGDSRIYRYRDDRLEQLTRDHSPVEQLVAMGLLDRTRAATHHLANVVTRAVGVRPDLAIDDRRERVQLGDRFVLCSDGLTRVVSDAEIAENLRAGGCAQIAQRLLSLSLSRAASDNVTIGVVVAGEEGEVSGKPRVAAS